MTKPQTDKTRAISPPPRPFIAVPPRPRLRLFGRPIAVMPSLWAWPLILSAVLVVAVMGWLRAQEKSDAEALRAAMISDALSLESQISAMLDGEQAKLRALADVVQAQVVTPEDFTRNALLLDGLRRFWVSVTWLAPDGRIIVQVPDDSVPAHAPTRQSAEDSGLAGHLSATLRPGGMLVARYAARTLLRQRCLGGWPASTTSAWSMKPMR